MTVALIFLMMNTLLVRPNKINVNCLRITFYKESWNKGTRSRQLQTTLAINVEVDCVVGYDNDDNDVKCVLIQV